MKKIVSMMKDCGRDDCEDSNCKYIIVEKKRTFFNFKKAYNEKSPINWFTTIGFFLFLLMFFTFFCLPILALVRF